MSEEAMAKIIGKNIFRLLESKNMNQVDLSTILNVNESTVGKWILGKSIPRMGTIEKISHFFNVNKSDLLNNNISLTISETSTQNVTDTLLILSVEEKTLINLWRNASIEGREAAKTVLTAYKKLSEDCAI